MRRLTEVRSRPRLVGRYFLAWLTWLVLIAQVSSFAHLVLVRHAVCPEHGELIHPHDGGVTPATHGGSASSAQIGTAVRIADEATDDHVHCPLALHRRQTMAVQGPALTIAEARIAQPDVYDLAIAPRAPPVALYRLAPKTSPPA